MMRLLISYSLFYFLAISNAAYLPLFSSFNGHQIEDLWKDPYDWTSWTGYGLSNPSNYLTLCGINQILGGPDVPGINIYFEKTFNNIAPHNFIRYRFRIWLIDDWASSDTFLIQLDNIDITKPNVGTEKPRWAANTCGNSASTDTGAYSIVGGTTHSSSSLTIRLVSRLSVPVTTASVGFRRLSMVFTNKTSKDSEGWCTDPYDWNNTVILPSDVCQCRGNTYWNTASSNCQTCHASCELCVGPTEYDCRKCVSTYSFVQGKCIACDSSCLDCFGPNPNQCLSCRTGSYFLHSDHTCRLTCDPAVQKQNSNAQHNYCETGCLGGLYFSHIHGGCIPSCSPPMVSINSLAGALCLHPCDDPTDYVFGDGSCSPSCNSPFTSTTTTDYKTCDSPCPLTTDYYYSDRKVCLTTCGGGYKIETVHGVKFCVKETLYTEDDIEQGKKLGQALDTMGQVTGGIMKAASALNSYNPSAVFLRGLSKMLEYLKFIQINYPPKLRVLLLSQESDPASLNFDIDMPQNLQDEFEPRDLPTTFQFFDIEGNFLISYWRTLMTLIIILGVTLVWAFIVFSTKNSPKVHLVFQRLYLAIKWNFLLIILCSTTGDIAFYTSLDLSTNRFNTAAAICSFLMCLFVNLALLYVLIKTLRISFILLKTPTDKLTLQQKKLLEPYQALYDSFDDKTFAKLGFLFFFMCRIYFFNIIIVVLHNFEILQCMLIIVLTIIMLAYIVLKRPFKSTFDMICLALNEVIILIIDICVFILAIMDSDGENYSDNQEKARDNIQEIIIGCNLAFTSFTLFVVCIQLLKMAIEVYKTIRTCRSKGVSSFVEIFLIIILGETPEQDLSLSSNNAKKSISLQKRRHPLEIQEKPSFSDTGGTQQRTIEEMENSTIYLKPQNDNNSSIYDFQRASQTIQPYQVEMTRNQQVRREFHPNYREQGQEVIFSNARSIQPERENRPRIPKKRNPKAELIRKLKKINSPDVQFMK